MDRTGSAPQERGDWLYSDDWERRWTTAGDALVRAVVVRDASRPGANALWRGERAARHLRELEDLALDALCDLEDRVWLQVGRALTETGHRRLWAALYALRVTARDPDEPFRSGDEVRFLARHREVALPPRPPGWPWPWLER